MKKSSNAVFVVLPMRWSKLGLKLRRFGSSFVFVRRSSVATAGLRDTFVCPSPLSNLIESQMRN